MLNTILSVIFWIWIIQLAAARTDAGTTAIAGSQRKLAELQKTRDG
jgi:hypothetical protein